MRRPSDKRLRNPGRGRAPG